MDYIAKSNHSDFDFILSPNIARNQRYYRLFKYRLKVYQILLSGFVLVRVKSFIVCNRNRNRNPKDKQDCYDKLSFDDYKFIPQMVNKVF